VGRNGVIVLQTRHVQHLLIRALETLTNDSSLLDEWEKQDLDTRKMLNLPPFSSLARVEGEMTSDISFANASVAQISDGSYLIRTQSKEDLRQLMTQLKESSVRVRVDMSPVRY
jgi:primosomal protein N'